MLASSNLGRFSEIVELRVKVKRFFRLFDYLSPNDMQQLSYEVAILNQISVFAVQPDPLVVNLNFVPLVILQVASIDHPEIDIDVNIEDSHVQL